MAIEREVMEYDIVIVGGGPAGLSTAIRFGQLCRERGKEYSVCLVEKGSEVGAHILSGAILDPRGLDQLLPDWREQGAPVQTRVVDDRLCYLSKRRAWPVPTALVPPIMRNEGERYLISLGVLCRWLSEQAEGLGIDIFPGIAAAQLIWAEDTAIGGVITHDTGVNPDGTHSDSFEPGMELRARHTVLAEGCRGHLGGEIIKRLGLLEPGQHRTYGLGLKELWEIDAAQHEAGRVVHTAGWPLPPSCYGGSFQYHMEGGQLAIGFVVGLDYTNPHMSPFQEFQRFKTHPSVRSVLAGGRRIAYGARALNEGGLQSLPRLDFAGGVLVGCEAGTLNVPKIKGIHTAMGSGILAAESLFDALESSSAVDFGQRFRRSWVWEELHRARNFRPSFRYGLFAGAMLAGIDQIIFHGNAPWTLRHRHGDHESLHRTDLAKPIHYPKPDGVVSFDRLSSVALANVGHSERQPIHLRLKDADIPVRYNLVQYDAPEQLYCPAGVYEIVTLDGTTRLQINASNCVHCKTCDIKDPSGNIVWVTPEGGGGPNYPNM